MRGFRLAAVLVVLSANVGAQTQLRSRQIFRHGDDLSNVQVRARDDGKVEIRSTHVSLLGSCLLSPTEALEAARVVLLQFGALPRVAVGEEVLRETEQLTRECPLHIEELRTSQRAEVRLIHETGAGLDLRLPVPSSEAFVSALRTAAAATDSMSAVSSASSAERPSVRAQQDAYFDFQVDKPAASAPGFQGPAYPEVLRAGGIEGEVLAQFIVDTTGRVLPESFRVLRSTHAMFEQAVRSSLPNMRFLPAELNARKVRQLVQQPFVFNLAR